MTWVLRIWLSVITATTLGWRFMYFVTEMATCWPQVRKLPPTGMIVGYFEAKLPGLPTKVKNGMFLPFTYSLAESTTKAKTIATLSCSQRRFTFDSVWAGSKPSS